jgi:hypothetical protein
VAVAKRKSLSSTCSSCRLQLSFVFLRETFLCCELFDLVLQLVEVIVLFIAILFLAPYWNNHPFTIKEGKTPDEVLPLLSSVNSDTNVTSTDASVYLLASESSMRFV